MNLYQLPLVALRGMIILPGIPVSFEVGRPQSIKAVEKAMEQDKRMFVTAQSDESEESVVTEQLYRIGTLVKIKQILHMHGGTARLVVEGFGRGIIRQITGEDPYVTCIVEEIDSVPSEVPEENEAYCKYLKRIFEEYFSM